MLDIDVEDAGIGVMVGAGVWGVTGSAYAGLLSFLFFLVGVAVGKWSKR